jgi:hypothetical protein
MPEMTPFFSRLLFVSTLVTGLFGCYQYDCPQTADARYYQDPAYVEVDVAPPPVQAAVAVRPPQPQASAVWVGGHYDWRGSWVWVDGHWETPRAGYVWSAPAVVTVGGAYRYHPGYWRPGRVEAAPVYRQGGTVAVSVRTPPRTTVQQGGTQTVTVQGGGNATTQGGANTVTVQGGTQTTATPGTRPTATVQGGTQTTVTPGTRPTATVRGGTQTTVAPGTRPTATVQGGTRGTGAATVQQPGVSVRTPNAGTRTTGATVATPTDGPRPNMTTTVQGGVRAGSPGTATVAAGGSTQNAGGTVALTCRTNTGRAPRGGYITVSGTGFGQGTTVMIGGNIASVSTAENGRLRAQVPRDSSGGQVSVQDGNRRANCGNLEIVGR